MIIWDYFVILLSLILAFVLQYTILPFIGVLNIAPDLLMGTTISIGLLFGPFPALVSGLVFGFFSDALLGFSIGIRMLQLALCGFSVGMFRSMLRRESFGLAAIFTFIGYFACGLLEFIIMYLMRIPPDFSGLLFLRFIASAGLSALVALPIYYLIYFYFHGEKRLRRVGGDLI